MSDTPEVTKLLAEIDILAEKERPIIPKTIELPDAVYQSDKALGSFIIHINELRSRIAEMDKLTKSILDAASEVMLQRLEATGLKNFAFDDLGTFSKRTSTKYSFPTGGKGEVAEYLQQLMDKGIVHDLSEVLDLQQSRLAGEPIEALREAVEKYNTEHPTDPIPELPFKTYESVALTAPKKRK